jgi:micrococcal nuclease
VIGRVVWVADGDTIHVQVGKRREKVRYIGVNAPEIPHPQRGWITGGPRASHVNAALVEGRPVRLELDLQSRDGYGRLLAYVWVTRAKRLVMANAELVRLGYAQAMTIPPNVRHHALFVALQREARAARRGLWRAARRA